MVFRAALLACRVLLLLSVYIFFKGNYLIFDILGCFIEVFWVQSIGKNAVGRLSACVCVWKTIKSAAGCVLIHFCVCVCVILVSMLLLF